MARKLRIAIVGDGGSIHNEFVMKWLVSRGHRVTFLTDVLTEVPGVIVRRVVPRHGLGMVRHLIAGKRVADYLRRVPHDVVHAQSVAGYGYWALLARCRPLIITCWGSDILRVPSDGFLQELAIKESLRHADLITGDAEHLNEAARELASPTAPVRWWQFGVELDRYRVDASRGRPPIVLSMRRHRPLYRIDVIVRAFAKVLKDVPEARLVLVGQDGETDRLKGLVDELGLHERTTFTGWVEENQLREWYARASVAVSVPESDSTPLSLLEAYASSLPMVLSDLPACREWLQDGVNGRLVAAGDVAATAEAVTDILLNTSRSQVWGDFNRSVARQHGDRTKNMRQLETWYEELVIMGSSQ